MAFRYAGFLFPVINGQLYVGKRGTEPHKGQWGAIGGKNEPGPTIDGLYNTIVKPWGLAEMRFLDRKLVEEGRESCMFTALREFHEEAYAREPTVDDLLANYRHPYKIGSARDSLPGDDRINWCEFYIAQVQDTKFDMSPRELHGLEPVVNVDSENIFPLSQLALLGLWDKFASGWYQWHDVLSQYPDLSKQISLPLIKWWEFDQSNLGPYKMNAKLETDRMLQEAGLLK